LVFFCVINSSNLSPGLVLFLSILNSSNFSPLGF
jgi:hypothetical protein